MKGTIGWICPRCEAVHAPSVKRCGCPPDASFATTTTKPNPSGKPQTGKNPPRIEMPTPKDPPGAPPRIIGADDLQEIIRATPLQYCGYHASPRAT